jgi:hypothetical protein
MPLTKLDPEIRAKLVDRGLAADAGEVETDKWIREKLPGLGRLFDFVEIVHSESDRGCVLCAAAIIDDALEGVIRQRLVALSNPSNEVLDKVLRREPQPVSKAVLDFLLTSRPQPPIGSFAVRTKLARALGLIDDNIMKALDGIRTMRNDAAHLAKPFLFESPRYNLEALFEPLSHKEQTYLRAMHMVMGDGGLPHLKPRRLFEIASASIFFRLNNIVDHPDEAAWYLASKFGPFDKYYDQLMSDPPDSKAAGKNLSSIP